eukprot:332198_1
MKNVFESIVSGDEDDNECLQCYETNNDKSIITSCKIIMHIQCLLQWYSQHDSCPHCRKPEFAQLIMTKISNNNNGKKPNELIIFDSKYNAFINLWNSRINTNNTHKT